MFILVTFCAVLVAQSCLIPWDPIDCSPPVSSVYRIFQARILEAACQAPLPTELSRQEYWSRLPCPPPEGLLNLGTDSTKIHLRTLYEENSTCYVSEMAQHKNIICKESHASVY